MSHPDELIGQQVDHYLVQAHLAGGGMAEVYLAQDTWLERPSALKVLKGMYAAEAEHRARFRREAQAIVRLAHPYIVEIYNIGTLADGRPYFTMPYLSGGSLADWLLRENGRPLSPAHALTLCRHIADALGTAHQAGMVHRDLKPANILLRGPLEPVVTDFGIAALSAQSVQLTRPGVFMGTYLYASPEQKLGLPVDHRSDIYSLGVILFELLAGVLPGGQQRPFDQLQQINPQLSPFLYDLVDRCLQQQPADRYPAAASLMLDLDLALSGVTETRPSPAPTQTRPRSPDWFWILLPVAAVLFVIGGYLFYAGTISTLPYSIV